MLSTPPSISIATCIRLFFAMRSISGTTSVHSAHREPPALVGQEAQRRGIPGRLVAAIVLAIVLFVLSLIKATTTFNQR